MPALPQSVSRAVAQTRPKLSEFCAHIVCYTRYACGVCRIHQFSASLPNTVYTPGKVQCKPRHQVAMPNSSDLKVSDDTWTSKYMHCAVCLGLLTGISFSVILALLLTNGDCIVQGKSAFSHRMCLSGNLACVPH